MESAAPGTFGLLFTTLVVGILYFLPTIMAYWSRLKRRGGILVINLFLGWTLIGWILALAWAVGGDTEPKADS